MADGDLFVGTNVRMRTELGIDLTNSVSIIYRWKKPTFADSEVTEEVDHTCSIEDVLSGHVYYDTVGDVADLENSDFDVRGEYEQHVFVTFSDGKTVPTSVSVFQVKNLWER